MGKQGYNYGDIGWMQLSSSAPASTIQFYSDLVGWSNNGEPMPGYHVFGKGEENLGGITALEDGQPGPAWVPFITVDDLDAAVAKAEELGGSIIQPITPIPQAGRIAVIGDPQGGATGLAQYGDGSSE
jgi:predicted enzyme related to lactoylglutathione lyase